MKTVFDPPEFSIKQLAYGWRREHDPIHAGQLFRIERGTPYQRSGKLAVATPQFNTQTIFSPTPKNSQLPAVTTAPVSISRPGRGGAARGALP